VVQDVHIGLFSIGNGDQGRNRAAQIQQRMELAGGFGGTKPCPRKQTQAQINRGRIQRINRLCQLDPKEIIGVKPAGTGDQRLRQSRERLASASALWASREPKPM
jgi:hypothetical protein